MIKSIYRNDFLRVSDMLIPVNQGGESINLIFLLWPTLKVSSRIGCSKSPKLVEMQSSEDKGVAYLPQMG